MVIVFSAILIPYTFYSIKVYGFIHSEDKMNSGSIGPNDPRSTHWTDFWVAFASALVMHCARWVLFNLGGKPLVRAIRIVKPGESKTIEENSVNTALDHIFKCLAYTIISIWGYMICKDKAWYPWYLGGPSDGHLDFSAFPMMKHDPDVYMYMLICSGMPIQNFVSLFIHERNPDFHEMLLHHIVHTTQMFCCLTVNLTPGGACSTIMHSVSDIALQSSKIIYLLGRMDGIMKLSVVPLYIAWPYFRLFCFVSMIYDLYKFEIDPEVKFLEPARGICVVFNSCLAFLNLYWFGLIFKILYRMAMKGETKDIHNDLSKQD